MIALIIRRSSVRDFLQMPVCPDLERFHGFSQRLSQWCERILDDWRHDWIDDALDQAIAFHRPQGLRQHFLRDAIDLLEQLAKTHRALCQGIDDQGRPVISDQYFHGGAYILGSLKSHRGLVALLSSAAGVHSLLIDYRLAPEHVFPAALDDALTAYRWLLANGTKPEHIVLAGDSAGGGLILALLQRARDKSIPMPAGAVLLSPWTDLVGTVESRTTRKAVDPIFSGEMLNFLASFYVGTQDAHHPLLSTINADLHGFPPLLIEVGHDEVLLDDALYIAEHAKAAHVPVELTVWDDMWHVFQQFASCLPEGRQSLENIGRFIRRQTTL